MPPTTTSRRTTSGPTYYVSTTGSDSNPGTLAAPWRTLTNSLPKLTAGSTLYLRGGTYFENQIPVNENGTASAPITIASYPGEPAVIDGGLPAYYSAPNSAWQLVDASIGLYRTTATYSGSFVGAWLLDSDVQLLQYSSSADLESTYYGPMNGSPVYMGPGVQLQSDGHIYIRLAPNPNDLTDANGAPVAAPIRDQNPNDHRMSVFVQDTLLNISGASNINFKNLTFEGPTEIFNASNSTNIKITGSTIRFGTYGLAAESGATNWTLTDNTWDNGFPSWTYWTDVKDTDEEAEGYPEFQSDAITSSGVGLVGFTITGNVFRDTMEGILLKDGSENDEITNNYFVRNHDDGIQIWHGAGGNVEIAGNMLWHIGGGIGVVYSTSVPTGPIYFHNNVVDDSIPERVGRPGNNYDPVLSPWMVWSPFSSHGGSAALWFYMYNNTIVSRHSVPYMWNPVGPTEITPSPNKKVYNNIFYALDDRVLLLGDQVSSGAAYDGDVLWRANASLTTRYSLTYDFGDAQNYGTLAAFRTARLGWEALGLQVDPGFSAAALEAATFDPSDPAALWSLYTPSNPRVLSPGFNLSRLGWPGASSIDYRGAVGA